MTPYYDSGGITIYHGDCREVIPSLAPLWSVVFADPPYSVSVPGAVHVREHGRGSRNFDFFPCDADWASMCGTIVEAVRMAALPEVHTAYVWCGHRQFGPVTEILEGLGYSTRFLIWKKHVPVPSPPRAGWSSAVELCVYAYRPNRVWTIASSGPSNVIEADNFRHGQPGKVDHPTQKPLSTALVPLRASTAAGDVVLDPFMGSGTTLRAAKDLGRKAIGIEIDERYCEIAAKRMGQEVMDFGGAA